eukprot:g2478.t1
MLKSDFEYRQRKLEQESSARATEEKRKRDVALHRQRRARKREEEHAAKQRQKQLELKHLEEEEESRRDQLRSFNRGTFLEAALSPIPLPEDTAISLGIKRWMDKIRLPASMSSELMQQGAPKNGALLFELTAENGGGKTHAGVLDFTAPEGTVGIPPHVAQCLWESGTCQGKVTVRYKRLLDGKFARLQPLRRGFHEAAGDDLRQVLEERLSQQSVLTEGDVLKIYLQNGEVFFDLKVVELEPASAVRIIDTDLEVDVIPSQETESLVKQRIQSTNQKLHFAKRRIPVESQVSEEEPGPSKVELEELPEEVAEGEENTIACCIRLPDGTSLHRRFRVEDSISNLFHFLKVKVGD